MSHGSTYGIMYKKARTDNHVDAKRWERLCRWWLDVEQTEMTNLGEFARAFGVAPTQLSTMVTRYKKRLQKQTC
jgi:hypothetical protein